MTTVREAIGIVAAETGKKAPKHALPTGLMKALTPIGPLVGKVMGQPPNLRELIASADGVTFWRVLPSDQLVPNEVSLNDWIGEVVHLRFVLDPMLPGSSTPDVWRLEDISVSVE